MDQKNQAETPGHHLDPASYRENPVRIRELTKWWTRKTLLRWRFSSTNTTQPRMGPPTIPLFMPFFYATNFKVQIEHDDIISMRMCAYKYIYTYIIYVYQVKLAEECT